MLAVIDGINIDLHKLSSLEPPITNPDLYFIDVAARREIM